MFESNREVQASRIKDVYKFLKDAGIEVYFRGQHNGFCTSKYCVIASLGETKLPSISSTTNTIEIMCYVPAKVASELDEYCDEVKEIMLGMRPMIKPMYNDIGDYIDDDIKAVMRTMQYKFYRKIEL